MKYRLAFGALCGVALMMLAGCGVVSKVGSLNPIHSGKKEAHRAQVNRIPLIEAGEELNVSDALKGQDFYLPPPAPQADWPVPGGTPEQSVEHVDAGERFVIAWKHGFGEASSRKHHITSPLIFGDGRIYIIDAGETLSAHNPATGATLWKTNLKPKGGRAIGTGWGGGVAYSDGAVYVASGYREMLRLDAKTGKIIWRSSVTAPIHAAPAVANGRVYAVDVQDELYAFNVADGVQAWTYQALTEPARMLKASSVAVANETVVASFASGELVALRAANGNELWNAALSKASRSNALSEIRDIAGRPVIYKSDVYAVSHSDVMAAVDLRTGSPRWTLPISATTTPWPAGDVVYIVDQSGHVICAAREGGQIYWMTNLNPGPKLKPGQKKKKIKHRTYWTSPILASNRLITVSDKGEAVALDPKTGAVQKRLHVGAPILISPIAVGPLIYLVSDNGQLIAIR
jgi:outer membrane protein assembly factor BamB